MTDPTVTHWAWTPVVHEAMREFYRHYPYRFLKQELPELFDALMAEEALIGGLCNRPVLLSEVMSVFAGWRAVVREIEYCAGPRVVSIKENEVQWP